MVHQKFAKTVKLSLAHLFVIYGTLKAVYIASTDSKYTIGCIVTMLILVS